MGKTLRTKNLQKKVSEYPELSKDSQSITIAVHKELNTDAIIERLEDKLGNGYSYGLYSTIHIDIDHEVCCPMTSLSFGLLTITFDHF